MGHVLKSETAKWNDRNKTSETRETTEATKTKRRKLPKKINQKQSIIIKLTLRAVRGQPSYSSRLDYGLLLIYLNMAGVLSWKLHTIVKLKFQLLMGWKINNQFCKRALKARECLK